MDVWVNGHMGYLSHGTVDTWVLAYGDMNIQGDGHGSGGGEDVPISSSPFLPLPHMPIDLYAQWLICPLPQMPIVSYLPLPHMSIAQYVYCPMWSLPNTPAASYVH